MISVIVLTLYNDRVAVNFNILCIRDNRNVQMLRNLRANLRCIPVNRLAACNNQVIVNISEGARDCRRCRPCICSAKYAVCHKNSLVRAHCHSLAKNLFCFRKSHRKNGNLGAILLFDSKCCFQTSFIIRVHNCKHCTSVKRTIRIELNSALCIRYLFYTNYYFHDMNLLISISFQK